MFCYEELLSSSAYFRECRTSPHSGSNLLHQNIPAVKQDLEKVSQDVCGLVLQQFWADVKRILFFPLIVFFSFSRCFHRMCEKNLWCFQEKWTCDWRSWGSRKMKYPQKDVLWALHHKQNVLLRSENIFRSSSDYLGSIKVVLTNSVAGPGKSFLMQKFTLDGTVCLENLNISAKEGGTTAQTNKGAAGFSNATYTRGMWCLVSASSQHGPNPPIPSKQCPTGHTKPRQLGGARKGRPGYKKGHHSGSPNTNTPA